MSKSVTVKVPDIGDFADVPVVEVLVAAGDEVEQEQSLISLESDKATMEIPAPQAGTVSEVLVQVGDSVSEGTPIIELMASAEAGATDKAAPASPASAAPPAPTPAQKPTQAPPQPVGQASGGLPDEGADIRAQVVVLGSGPGGYTAAFRAADLGLETVLIERYPALGGVCLNVGCIPSKALLHTAAVIDEAAAMAEHGVSFGTPAIDLDKLRQFKDSVVGQLTGGLKGLAKKRKVTVIKGYGRFSSPNTIEVSDGEQVTRVGFEKAIIAAGSQAIKLPGMPWDDPRLMDSTDALDLSDIPERMLIIGGGIIGMEMASVYAALGTRVTICELMDQLMPGADLDLVKPFHRFVKGRYENIFLKTRVTTVVAEDAGLKASFEGDQAPAEDTFDRILVAVGRSPNGKNIGAELAGVNISDRGFISVDRQLRTNVPHIFAIGDIVGQPMLAHKATHEGKVAAEVCAGMKSAFEARVIPSVAYTDPEVAWVGLTELEAKEQGIVVEKGVFPWAASGRALGLARSEGMTKLLFDPQTERVVGGGIVGPHAGDLIAEVGLAIEMGCDAADVGLTIHPHPTLSETVAFSAEAFEGTITDLYMPKKAAN
ncbi:MAG: dihydrolipoyl dehydrogenase [Pseudomonadota bacterium]